MLKIIKGLTQDYLRTGDAALAAQAVRYCESRLDDNEILKAYQVLVLLGF